MTDKKIPEAKQPEISDAEREAAKKEGVIDAVKQTSNTQDLDRLDGEEDPKANRFPNATGTNQIEGLTDLGLNALKELIDPKKDGPLDETVIANILVLERNGKNRTDFVKLLMDRLNINDIRKELPQAGGPDYTNDVSNITEL